MKIEKIKPIPKHIIELIKKRDKHDYPAQNGATRYYDYLTKNDGELCKITVAVRNHYKKWYCKQVIVHGIDSKDCYLKDIVCYMIAGYKTGWYEQGLAKVKNWWEHHVWDLQDDKYFNIYCPIVNENYIDKFPEFKYSAYRLYRTYDLFKYLKIYKQFPEAEYMLKMGLNSFCRSKTILRKVRKDKSFRKWLAQHRNEIRGHYYYASTLLKAYKTNRPLQEVQSLEIQLKYFNVDKDNKPLKELFKGEIDKFLLYINKQSTNCRNYLDYLRACQFLNIDMSLDKNRYPHDFKRWHDIRINEYTSEKAKFDEIERKKQYKIFKKIAQKYMPLQEYKKGNYIIVIAQSPAELAREGKKLHHCVGRMGYDQKFIKEQSLIFFVREKSKPKTPYITIEYSPEKKKILQSHGEHNSAPNDNVKRFLEKQWLPFANKQLKQIAA